MKVVFLKWPTKFFWNTVTTFFIFVNLVIYLYEGMIMEVPASTGYTIHYWEKIIMTLKDFYQVGL